jgi:methyltransferase (TIGR00027 family)
MIVRTQVLDELITRAIENDGADLVLNLAAGLDTRPYRMVLAPTLHWVEVDFAPLLEAKREILGSSQPGCRLETVALDLTDRPARQALFRRLGAEGQRALVLTEGLLVYLTEAQVAGLAEDLHAVPSFRWWLTDLAGPQLLKMLAKRWGPALKAGNAPMQFAPAAGPAFFQPYGWELGEFRSTWDEAHRLGREMRLAWLWRLLGRLYPAKRQEEFRTMSGMVRLVRRND